MHAGGAVAPAGALGMTLIRNGQRTVQVQPTPRDWPHATSLRNIIQFGLPQAGLSEEVNRWRRANMRHLWRGAKHVIAAQRLGIPTHYGALFGTLYRGSGEVVHLGLMSLRVVTDAGVGYIVDAFQNTVELENMKYHGYGTGSTAEAAGDTALVTELTTEYATDNVRPTGTTIEGATANIFRTVATLSPNSGGTIALREHGVFSQAAVAGGVMLDRTVYAVVNVTASADSLQTTYDFTLTSGS